MIDDFYRAYFVPTYKERQAEAFDNLRNRVAAYRGEEKESIKYRPVSKEQVFAVLCMAAQSPGGLYDPGIRSVHDIANQLMASEYQTRKCVRQLVNDGLAKVEHSGGIDDDGYPHCYHGFAITKAATQTQTYRDADKAMLEEFAAMCADNQED